MRKIETGSISRAAMVQQQAGSQQTNISFRAFPRAFTLLEMLAVLVVIALAAIVAAPALTRARSSAQRSTCFNNIHQCGLAINLYIEDYDNAYPSYRVDTRYALPSESLLEWHDAFCRAAGTQPGQLSWVSLTRHYADARSRASQPPPNDNSADVYHCPQDNTRGTTPTSYEFKMLLATGLPLYEVHSPSATALLWEQWAFHGEPTLSEYDRRAEMTLVFTDGHAAWIRLADTTNALYSKGPDLHWLPSDPAVPTGYREEDVAY